MNKASTYDESIFDLYVEEKLTMKEVADTLGISVGKVFNRLKVMGVHSRGHKDYPASEEVIENCRKLGLSGKGKKLSEKTKALIAEAHFKGGIGHKYKHLFPRSSTLNERGIHHGACSGYGSCTRKASIARRSCASQKL